MNVDFWLDLGCPWSYLTLRHLRAALAAFPHANEVDVTIRPFFLEADDTDRSDTPWMQHLIENEDYTPTEALELRDRLIALGQAEGMTFKLDSMLLAPTAGAWRVICAARSLDWQSESTSGPDTLSLKVTEALMRARFEMALDLAAEDVLIGCAQDVGIAPEEAAWALSDPARADEVWSEYQLAAHMGVDSVPTLLINNEFVVQGMQPRAAMTNILTTAWAHQAAASERKA